MNPEKVIFEPIQPKRRKEKSSSERSQAAIKAAQTKFLKSKQYDWTKPVAQQNIDRIEGWAPGDPNSETTSYHNTLWLLNVLNKAFGNRAPKDVIYHIMTYANVRFWTRFMPCLPYGFVPCYYFYPSQVPKERQKGKMLFYYSNEKGAFRHLVDKVERFKIALLDWK